jgi:predicted dehydrogenase
LTLTNIALIGCGWMGGDHAAVFAQLPEARLVAVVDTELVKAEKLAARYQIPACYRDYQAVLERDDITGVVILTPTDSHCESAMAAAAAGKDILLEKPMALDLAESQAIIDAANQHGVKLMIGQTARFEPLHLALKAAIEAGEVGRPVYLHVTWHHGFFWRGGWRAWQIRPGRSGGHIVHNGIHVLDLTAWLLGQPIESVYTQTHRRASPHLETEEDFRLIIRCAGGALALCEISYALPTRGAFLRTIELIGDEGRASHSTLNDGLLFHSSGIEFLAPLAPGAMLHQNRAFARYLQEGGSSPVPGTAGQQALAAALAARRSAEEGRPVRVEEVEAEVQHG